MSGTAPASDQYVQSLARGLQVIRAFDAEHVQMTLSDVSRRTGLTRATARRFLLTLVELGYVRTDGRTFELTALVLQLGYSYLSGQSLPQLAQPVLEDLSRAISESTSASILDGNEIVYIARIHTRRLMTVGISVGTRFPAYATSMGRVLLAGLSGDRFEEYLATVELRPLTDRTVTDPDRLRSMVARVREQGWAIVDQELEQGLRSVAVPIFDPRGQVLAALNTSMQAGLGTEAPTLEEAAARVVPHLQQASATITAALAAQS
ncbi:MULTISPECIES: IclR family transcriptional regulator domain-containing protein [unclassified Arthrobacter]|uniref:IclR family transcriptional regulator domain-containing protein n=1 Tax=unclassified Arthrobacter TaxID=235627 RepID=UPI001D143F1F|nr:MULTISPECIES: IclR family transcriptional regulator C-terminal domain-containing protein [unclassified Arthrobacter]MCC3276075.1 helix-turn-helix domain-containing protein [Arthrobacter sp. zg-Y20]MCC9176339.1 helix-turn-helix domain-containing protein [Arthrobacter sp. zg-Y750]MDK1316233.1 IclR family transcriptional regulator C-terminal domain-containing protein [Arthrobacter sp. zg.Y20]WIB05488.1 IclR family transcriptional regulator C-terminal domain-containing protein [Arthrobacter sp. 